MLVLFPHGLNSVPGGVKPTYLADHGHGVINPQPPDDIEEVVWVAQGEFDRYNPDVVVGSSEAVPSP
jgi:hypothetical protein